MGLNVWLWRRNKKAQLCRDEDAEMGMLRWARGKTRLDNIKNDKTSRTFPEKQTPEVVFARICAKLPELQYQLTEDMYGT